MFHDNFNTNDFEDFYQEAKAEYKANKGKTDEDREYFKNLKEFRKELKEAPD